MNILNLGAGKLTPIVDDKIIAPLCTVHVDQSYFYGHLPRDVIKAAPTFHYHTHSPLLKNLKMKANGFCGYSENQ